MFASHVLNLTKIKRNGNRMEHNVDNSNFATILVVKDVQGIQHTLSNLLDEA